MNYAAVPTSKDEDKLFPFGSPQLVLTITLAAAAAFRIVSTFILRTYLHPTTWEFGELAHRIVMGQGYTDALPNGISVPSAYMPPFYTYFLATVWKLFGESWTTYLGIELFQSGLGVLLVLVVYRLGALLFSIRVAQIAAIMTAAWPSFIYLGSQFHSISFYILFGLAAVYFLTRYIEASQSWKDVVLLGLCLGVVLLCRAEAVAIVFLYATILLWRCGRRSFRQAVATVVIAFACLLPWTIRNARAFRHPVLVTTSGGGNLFIGHNPLATGNGDVTLDYLTPQQRKTVNQVMGTHDTEVLLDQQYKSWAFEFARSHPRRELQLALRKLFLFFAFDPQHKKGRKFLYWGPSLSLAIFAAGGAWIHRRHLLHRELPLTATICFAIGTAVVVFALPRYRIAIDPLLVLFAALAVDDLLQRQCRFRHNRRIT